MNRLSSAFLMTATTALAAGCATDHPSLSQQWRDFTDKNAPEQKGNPPKGMEKLARQVQEYNVQLYSDPSQFPMSGDNFFTGIKTQDHKTVYMGTSFPLKGGTTYLGIDHRKRYFSQEVEQSGCTCIRKTYFS